MLCQLCLTVKNINFAIQEHSYTFTYSQIEKPSISLLAVLSRVVIQCSLHTRARFYNKRLWAFQWSSFLHMYNVLMYFKIRY